MDLTRALKDVRFDLEMRGYSCDAVDAFLAKTRNEVADLISQRDAARSRVDALENQVNTGESDTEGTLRRTLVLAQRLADETVADAKATAESMVVAATNEAAGTKEQARSEADTMLKAANDEAAESRELARQELERAQEDAARVSEEAAASASAAQDQSVQEAEQILSDAEKAGQDRVAALEATAVDEVARMREPIRAEITQLEETRSSLVNDIEALEHHLTQQRVRVRTAVESLRAGMSGSIEDLERVATDEEAMNLDPRPPLADRGNSDVPAAAGVDVRDAVNEHASPAPSAAVLAATAAESVAQSMPDPVVAETAETAASVSEVEPVDEDLLDPGPATEPIPVVDVDAADLVDVDGDDVADVDGDDVADADMVDLDSEPSHLFGTSVAGNADVADAEMVDVADDPEAVDESDSSMTSGAFVDRFTDALGTLPIRKRN